MKKTGGQWLSVEHVLEVRYILWRELGIEVPDAVDQVGRAEIIFGACRMNETGRLKAKFLEED